MKKIRSYINYLRVRIRRDPVAFRIYSILRVLVILVAIRQLVAGNFEGFAICILSLLLFLLPSLLEDHFKIEIPTAFEIIIYLFIFAAEILGEVDAFYTAIPGWDTMLHTINGFLAAAVGFSLVDLLNRHSKRVDLSPFYLALAAFCFSMTIGVLWEFIECAADLFVNFIGAVVFSTLGYFYVKRREKLNKEVNRADKLTRSLIVRNIMDEDEEFRAEEDQYQVNQEAAIRAAEKKKKK